MNKIVAVNNVSKVTFIPLREELFFYERIDTTNISWWKWFWNTPSRKLKRGTIFYKGLLGHWYTIEEVLKNESDWVCLIDGLLYKKAKVIITYLDSNTTVIKYNSNEEAYNKYKELCELFGLNKEIEYQENYE